MSDSGQTNDSTPLLTSGESSETSIVPVSNSVVPLEGNDQQSNEIRRAELLKQKLATKIDELEGESEHIDPTEPISTTKIEEDNFENDDENIEESGEIPEEIKNTAVDLIEEILEEEKNVRRRTESQTKEEEEVKELGRYEKIMKSRPFNMIKSVIRGISGTGRIIKNMEDKGVGHYELVDEHKNSFIGLMKELTGVYTDRDFVFNPESSAEDITNAINEVGLTLDEDLKADLWDEVGEKKYHEMQTSRKDRIVTNGVIIDGIKLGLTLSPMLYTSVGNLELAKSARFLSMTIPPAISITRSYYENKAKYDDPELAKYMLKASIPGMVLSGIVSYGIGTKVGDVFGGALGDVLASGAGQEATKEAIELSTRWSTNFVTRAGFSAIALPYLYRNLPAVAEQGENRDEVAKSIAQMASQGAMFTGAMQIAVNSEIFGAFINNISRNTDSPLVKDLLNGLGSFSTVPSVQGITNENQTSNPPESSPQLYTDLDETMSKANSVGSAADFIIQGGDIQTEQIQQSMGQILANFPSNIDFNNSSVDFDTLKSLVGSGLSEEQINLFNNLYSNSSGLEAFVENLQQTANLNPTQAELLGSMYYYNGESNNVLNELSVLNDDNVQFVETQSTVPSVAPSVPEGFEPQSTNELPENRSPEVESAPSGQERIPVVEAADVNTNRFPNMKENIIPNDPREVPKLDGDVRAFKDPVSGKVFKYENFLESEGKDFVVSRSGLSVGDQMFASVSDDNPNEILFGRNNTNGTFNNFNEGAFNNPTSPPERFFALDTIRLDVDGPQQFRMATYAVGADFDAQKFGNWTANVRGGTITQIIDDKGNVIYSGSWTPELVPTTPTALNSDLYQPQTLKNAAYNVGIDDADSINTPSDLARKVIADPEILNQINTDGFLTQEERDLLIWVRPDGSYAPRENMHLFTKLIHEMSNKVTFDLREVADDYKVLIDLGILREDEIPNFSAKELAQWMQVSRDWEFFTDNATEPYNIWKALPGNANRDITEFLRDQQTYNINGQEIRGASFKYNEMGVGEFVDYIRFDPNNPANNPDGLNRFYNSILNLPPNRYRAAMLDYWTDVTADRAITFEEAGRLIAVRDLIDGLNDPNNPISPLSPELFPQPDYPVYPGSSLEPQSLADQGQGGGQPEAGGPIDITWPAIGALTILGAALMRRLLRRNSPTSTPRTGGGRVDIPVVDGDDTTPNTPAGLPTGPDPNVQQSPPGAGAWTSNPSTASTQRTTRPPRNPVNGSSAAGVAGSSGAASGTAFDGGLPGATVNPQQQNPNQQNPNQQNATQQNANNTNAQGNRQGGRNTNQTPPPGGNGNTGQQQQNTNQQQNQQTNNFTPDQVARGFVGYLRDRFQRQGLGVANVDGEIWTYDYAANQIENMLGNLTQQQQAQVGEYIGTLGTNQNLDQRIPDIVNFINNLSNPTGNTNAGNDNQNQTATQDDDQDQADRPFQVDDTVYRDGIAYKVVGIRNDGTLILKAGAVRINGGDPNLYTRNSNPPRQNKTDVSGDVGNQTDQNDNNVDNTTDTDVPDTNVTPDDQDNTVAGGDGSDNAANQADDPNPNNTDFNTNIGDVDIPDVNTPVDADDNSQPDNDNQISPEEKDDAIRRLNNGTIFKGNYAQFFGSRGVDPNKIQEILSKAEPWTNEEVNEFKRFQTVLSEWDEN